ncbi:MAG: helix-turn-helix domain-containing protein [Propionibacteriaceae bacterium]|nr:helix-turn-helix domain-containing protein [Propionibacteriaceae bacterium]
MLTTTQAAEILNVSRVTLVKLLEDGTFDLTTDEFMSALEEIRHGQRS